MRVLHTLNELRPSGAEVMLRVSAEHWARRGVELAVLSAGDEVGPFAAALAGVGIRVHHIPMKRGGRFVWGLLRLMREEQYDVVHVHAERGNVIVGLVARMAGSKRVVRTVHNVFAFRGALRAERIAHRALLRLIGVRHVSVGQSVSSSELKFFFNPTTLVYNWFNQSYFVRPTAEERNVARKNLAIAENEFVILTLGNCSIVKNHYVVIEALQALGVHGQLVYLHAGMEQDGYTERSLAKALGVADQCRFLGRVGDVRSLMWASDCYVMPSQWEGLPISALEAMACGLPSVLAEVPGLRDLRRFVDDGIEWVSPTADGITSGVAAIIGMSERDRRVSGELASASVHRHFSIDRGVEEYLRVYGRTSR